MLRVRLKTIDVNYKNIIQPPIRQAYEQCSFTCFNTVRLLAQTLV